MSAVLDLRGVDTWLARLLHERGLVELATLQAALAETRAAREAGGSTLARSLVARGAIGEAAVSACLVELARAGGGGAAWSASARRLGPYLLEGRLGAGGMGVVWRARHVETGAPCAVKTLAAGAEHDLRERFLREGAAQAAIAHPNVVRIHSAGVAEGTLFLAMALAEGGSLEDRLRGGPLDPDAVARLGVALARGLGQVHARGVLHRDLKPANVLFDAQGTPQLTDFGLAALVGERSLTQTGDVLGTPAYMAPEEARGDHAAIDARTDVYGLGAVLYRALTGRPPVEGRSVMALLHAVVHAAPRAPRIDRPEVPAALERIVLRALAKQPRERYPSPDALADALEGFLAGAPPERSPARWRGAAWAAAALLVAGALVVAFVGDDRRRTDGAAGPTGPGATAEGATPAAELTAALAAYPADVARLTSARLAAAHEADLALQRGLAALVEACEGGDDPGRVELAREALGPRDPRVAFVERASALSREVARVRVLTASPANHSAAGKLLAQVEATLEIARGLRPGVAHRALVDRSLRLLAELARAGAIFHEPPPAPHERRNETSLRAPFDACVALARRLAAGAGGAPVDDPSPERRQRGWLAIEVALAVARALDVDEAARACDLARAPALAPDDRERLGPVRARLFLTRGALSAGELPRLGPATAEQVLHLADRVPHKVFHQTAAGLSAALQEASLLERRRGHPGRGRALAERALTLQRRCAQLHDHSAHLGWSTSALLLLGDAAAARRELDALGREPQRSLPFVVRGLAEVRLATGDVAAALELLGDAPTPARFHARLLARATPRPEALAHANAVASLPQDGSARVPFPWHWPEHLVATLEGAWWPGAPPTLAELRDGPPATGDAVRRLIAEQGRAFHYDPNATLGDAAPAPGSLKVGEDLEGATPPRRREALWWFLRAATSTAEISQEWERASQAAAQAQAAYRLGTALMEGLHVRRDVEEAVVWLRRAADVRHPDAMHLLGECRLNGQGGPEDVQEGIRWLNQAAAAGNANAMFALGREARAGTGGAPDAEAAVRWFEQAAKAGNPIAEQERRDTLALGELLREPPGEALDELWRAAWTGALPAVVRYGEALDERGAPGDARLARALFRYAAERGSERGMVRLGRHLEALATDRAREEAADWFEEAARGGSAAGMLRLARCYRTGSGRPPDSAEARRWLERAAEAAGPAGEAARAELRQLDGER